MATYKRIFKKIDVSITKGGRVSIIDKKLEKFVGQKFDIIVEKVERKVKKNAN